MAKQLSGDAIVATAKQTKSFDVGIVVGAVMALDDRIWSNCLNRIRLHHNNIEKWMKKLPRKSK